MTYLKTRQTINAEILQYLSAVNEQHGDLRFYQLLVAAGLDLPANPLFYEESETTLSKMLYNIAIRDQSSS